MGFLSDKVREFWADIKNGMSAHADLKAAIGAHDLEAAKAAISHTYLAERTADDESIKIVREYGKTADANHDFFRAMCEAIYAHQDTLVFTNRLFDPERSDPKKKTGYEHPYHVYGIAAYLGDIEKLRELAAKGISPDQASDYGNLKESIVMGTARIGNYEAMKEVIRQGASLDKNFGWDDFPPLHAFSKPLFHAFHPGVTEALLETGNKQIIEEVNKALSQMKPAPGPSGPGMRP